MQAPIEKGKSSNLRYSRSRSPDFMWHRIQKFLSAFVPAVILLLYCGILVCFLNRWDSMVAVTLIPFWAWAAVGVLLCLLSWIFFRGPSSIVVLCLWLATSLFFSEETHTLFRELSEAIDPKTVPENAELLRIASFQSTTGELDFQRISDLKPDILLLQLSDPKEETIRELADHLFGMDGAYFTGGDNAIIARGEFLNILEDPENNCAHARLRRKDGFLIDITGISLPASIPSPYLWKKSTWDTLTELRKTNRQRVRGCLGENPITRPNTARLVAGGFNTPPGDDIFRPLETNRMQDSFHVSGHGWGNTFKGEYPLLRLDQIWISENLIPLETETASLPGSIHRAVVAEVMIAREEESR
ncbi:MAG: hypothetical protein MI807_07740 [Verrucomicrobiales bacterium]|nr:hypothetical protein [Verrucomicrobiales bacterium]